MSTMLPHKKSTTALMGLLLIDLPFLLVVATVGWKYGYVHTWEAISEWRFAHPWTFIPSIVLAVLLIRRWRRA